ncbi:MAG: cyclic nucleotide-binding domain-containing protein [Myxococcales bacterium]|nr:cyclic nucleotide-binding domain-containing protein [Myxococcales bacterium]
MDRHDLAGLLRGTHLFAELDPPALAELVAACSLRQVARGEVVTREGEPGDAVHVVVGGAFTASAAGPGGEVTLAEMRRGEYFGEIALLEQGPRTATVRASSDGAVASLARDDLRRLLDRRPEIEAALLAGLRTRLAWSSARARRPPDARLLELLAGFFPGLPAEGHDALAAELEWVTLARGETLIRQGDAADCLYLLVEGRVSVEVADAAGQTTLVGESGAGETIGEMALISSAPRSATVSAARECSLLRLSRRGLDQLVARHPQAAATLARGLVEKMNQRTRARAVVAQLRGRPPVGPDECEAVAHTPNLVLRNLRITQMYHRLSQELALLIGRDDANWCTFACNASKTAGYSIRREELPLHDLLTAAGRSPALAALGRGVIALVDRTDLPALAAEVLDAVSAAISAGNLKVYAELAPVFARFVAGFHAVASPDPARLAALTADLRRGPSELGGQDLLGEALAHYHAAMFEPSAKRKAELILLGNCKIGLHEQTRLQPNIAEALAAPLTVGLRALPRGRLAARLEGELLRRVTGVWRRLVTDSMMTLRLPYGAVRLGADLPGAARMRLYADTLQSLEHPELRRFVARFDRSGPDMRGSRARDWGDLDDRMNFIVNLFRSRQKNLELFDQPFLFDQRQEIDGGRVPAGAL